MEDKREKYYGEGYQPLDFLYKNPEHGIGFTAGNILKYTTRAGFKEDAVSDIKKVIHYIQELQKFYKNGSPVEESLWVDDHDKVIEMIIGQELDITARLLKLKIISNIFYNVDDTALPKSSFDDRLFRSLIYSNRLKQWFEENDTSDNTTKVYLSDGRTINISKED